MTPEYSKQLWDTLSDAKDMIERLILISPKSKSRHWHEASFDASVLHCKIGELLTKDLPKNDR